MGHGVASETKRRLHGLRVTLYHERLLKALMLIRRDEKMPSRIRHGLLMGITIITFLLISFISSYAETITYFYDDLNRLIRIVYDTGIVIEYTYDEVGNRLMEARQPDTTPPTGTIVIDSGEGFTNSATVTLTLSCYDFNGCSQMQFSNDNVTYSTPEPFASTKVWTLSPGSGVKTVYIKLRDAAGVWSNPFTDTIMACSSSSARIGSTSYATLQAAYNAAGNGDIIKSLDMRLIENLTVNRNIAVTLEGGYDCGYTTNSGGTTAIKGMVTTTAGGGTITIKNFILER